MKTEKIHKLRFYLTILLIILLWYVSLFKAEIDASYDFTSKIAFLLIGFSLIMTIYIVLMNRYSKLTATTYKEVNKIPYAEKINELRYRIITLTMVSFWLFDNVMIPIFEKYHFSNWKVFIFGAIYFLYLTLVFNTARKYFKLINRPKKV